MRKKKIEEATTPPTQKPWSDFHNAKYMQLKNYLLKTDPSLNPDTFIDDKKQQLVEIIEANPKWGESNTMGLFFTIAMPDGSIIVITKTPLSKYSVRKATIYNRRFRRTTKKTH